MEKQEAIDILKKEIVCWQSNASFHYSQAMFHRDQYLDGCASNTMLYEYHMKLAYAFHHSGMITLIAIV